jgi:hypothetical protein
VDEVRIVCNSELDPAALAVSRYVRETVLKDRWNQVHPEVEALLRPRYGTVVLDEGHEACRRGGLAAESDRPYNLLEFMRVLGHEAIDEDGEDAVRLAKATSGLTSEERGCLATVITELSRPEASDPKLEAVLAMLRRNRSEGKTWLEHGCIVFSQYYDTASWVASQLALRLPGEPVAVYAGVGKSRMFEGGESSSVEREAIKPAVKRRGVRLLVATDAACEGPNLQTLGTLIHVDLPWNPSRLEQRLGRVKRFGQARRSVDMLNLVYRGTRDQAVYQALSRRLRGAFDLFGSLPARTEDDWVDSVECLERELDQYKHLRDRARNAFELKYSTTIDPGVNRWERCSRVLSRSAVVERLSRPC